MSPRITRITRKICVTPVISWQQKTLRPLRLCVRQENNIAHRIHKIHRMSLSAWSESETNRNSVCSVLSVCKQIREIPVIRRRQTINRFPAERLNLSTDHEDHEEVLYNPCNQLIIKKLCALCAFAWDKKIISHTESTKPPTSATSQGLQFRRQLLTPH